MGYIYALLWIVIGILIFIKLRGVNPAIYIISFYFEIMGGWWIVNEVTNINMFQNPYIIIFRVISAVVLIIAVLLYFKEKRKVR